MNNENKRKEKLLSPREVLKRYQVAKRTITPAFLDSIDFEAMRGLPRDGDIMKALSYMAVIEDSVWSIYFKEVAETPTGKNPIIREFLKQWKIEEGRHADLLNRILDENGGPVPLDFGEPYDSSWIARLVGERIFGAIHMSFGATNELMAGYGYRRLATLTDNPELSRVLLAIAAEESLHYSFYHGMAQHYLGRSFIARQIAPRVLNAFAVGVGIGVLTPDCGHAVINILFKGYRKDFLDRVEAPMKKLPGFGNFKAMSELMDRAEMLAKKLQTEQEAC